MYQINFDSAIPIYEQIFRQAQCLIASGAFPEGELIPSVRETSRQLGINPQTVNNAYTELKNLDLIRPQRGQGFYVTPGARAKCKNSRYEAFQTQIENTLSAAVAGQLTPQEIRGVMEAAYANIANKYFPNYKENDNE